MSSEITAAGEHLADEAVVGVAATTPSSLRGGLRLLWRSGRLAIFGMSVLGIVLLGAIFIPWLSPFDATTQDLFGRLAPPGTTTEDGLRVMGTDALGRDVMTRIFVGARFSLFISFVSVVGAMVLGTTIGLLSGYHGRWVDSIFMRAVDVQLSFPIVLLALALVAVFGPSISNVIMVFVLTGWPVFARITRASTLSLRSRDFVEASIGLGERSGTIIRRHILPNAVGPLLVVATFEFAKVLIFESSLSFLGLGVQPPTPTWGNMMADGRDYLNSAWWITTLPGLILVLTAASANWIGDGLNAVIDPRQRRRS